MTLFKDLVDGAIFFTRGGENLMKVMADAPTTNAVFVDATNLGVLLSDTERTFTLEEFKAVSADDKRWPTYEA